MHSLAAIIQLKGYSVADVDDQIGFHSRSIPSLL